MKILYATEVVLGMEGKGADIHVRESVRALEVLGHAVHVIGRGDASGLETRGERVAVQPVVLPFVGTFLTQRRFYRSVRALIRRLCPDVVYLRLEATSWGGVSACGDEGIPFFVEVNGDLPRELEILRAPRRLRLLCRRVEAKAYARAFGIVAVAESVKQSILNRYPLAESKIIVIGNGASADRFFPEAPLAEAYRSVIGQERFRWIFVGAAADWYAIPDVLRVQKFLEDKGVALWIAGDGPLLAEWKRTAEDLGLKKVRFLGRVPHAEVPGLLSASDLGVLAVKPLTAVGAHIKLGEYLASGLPVAFRAGTNTWKHFLEAGAGIAVDYDEPERAAEQIVRFLHDADRRRETAQKARRYFLEEMTWERVMGRIVSFMQERMGKEE